MICGNAMMLRLQIMSAMCCRMIDTPIAVMSGARRGAPQRPVGEALHAVADQHADRHRAAGADQDDDERGSPVGTSRLMMLNATIAPDHPPPCAVDELDDAVHHGVAERHHRVHASRREPVDHLLQEGIHAAPPGGPFFLPELMAPRYFAAFANSS